MQPLQRRRTASDLPGLDLAEQKSWQSFVEASLRLNAAVSRWLADAHDLSGFNGCPCGRRLVADGLRGRPVVMRPALDLHPEARVIKFLFGGFFRLAHHVRDFDRTPAHG